MKTSLLLIIIFYHSFFVVYGQNKPQIMISSGHTYPVSSIAISPDNKLALTGSLDNFAKLWEIATGRELMTLPFDDPCVNFSADGNFIYLQNYAKFAKYDLKSGKLLNTAILSKKIDSLGKSYLLLVRTFSYSSNGKFALYSRFHWSEENLNDLVLVDMNNGEIIKTFQKNDSSKIEFITFSPDNKYAYTVSYDHTIKKWEIPSGKMIQTFSPPDFGIIDYGKNGDYRYPHIIFSNDCENVFYVTKDLKLVSWNFKTKKILVLLQKAKPNLFSTNDNKFIIACEIDSIKIIEQNSGRISVRIPTKKKWAMSVSPNYKFILESFGNNYANNLRQINLQNGEIIQEFRRAAAVHSVGFTKDQKSIVCNTGDTTIHIWDLAQGKKIKTFYNLQNWIDSKYFNPEIRLNNFRDYTYLFNNTGELLLWGNGKHIQLDNITTKQNIKINLDSLLNLTKGHQLFFDEFLISPNGKFAVINSLLYDITSSKFIRPISFKTKSIDNIITDKSATLYAFSPDNKYILGSKFNDFVLELWETKTLTNFRHINLFDYMKTACFSNDGQWVAYNENKDISIWDILSNNKIKTFKGHKATVYSLCFSLDKKYLLTGSLDATMKLWDVATGAEIATMYSFGGDDWLVTTPTGLFDASAGAQKLLYFVQGVETIELDQLKNRYYEPGLLQKLMGYNKEKIRDVKGLGSLDLYPEIELSDVKDGKFSIKLKNRGGGIGKVKVYINGKEVIEDARDSKTPPDAAEMSVSWNIDKHPYLVPGKENIISVRAYNKEGWLLSREATTTYKIAELDKASIPNVFIVSCGVSDYTGTEIDLRFAAKDATDIAYGIQTGAKRLFGTDKTHVYLLTTDTIVSKNKMPTKQNIIKTFDDISKIAKSTDIIVVYLSGHGINLGGQDGDFYYLTQEAYSGSPDAYNDPAIRTKTTLSSAELVELIKKVPALKQVLIIDACASGRVVENLMVQKDIPSSTLRALDRMKDRTGMHIITGCTSDAVSYESNRFGQGLLTYSLLEGMKGASLREEKYVDIVKWFGNSRERVPVLAEGIGGIQTPQIFSPYGSQSFDIGELTTEDKTQIPLAKSKPLFIYSVFQDAETFDDALLLGKKIDEKFREYTFMGKTAPLILIESQEFPNAYRLRGQYSINGNAISVKANLFAGKEKKHSFELIGTKDKINELIDELVKKAKEAAK